MAYKLGLGLLWRKDAYIMYSAFSQVGLQLITYPYVLTCLRDCIYTAVRRPGCRQVYALTSLHALLTNQPLLDAFLL